MVLKKKRLQKLLKPLLVLEASKLFLIPALVAEAVAAMPGWRVDLSRVQSNMVFAFPRSGDLAAAKEPKTFKDLMRSPYAVE